MSKHHSSSLSNENKTGNSALLHILVDKKKKAKTKNKTKQKKKKKKKKYPEVQDCIVEKCLDVPLKFGIHQYIKQLFSQSGTRKL